MKNNLNFEIKRSVMIRVLTIYFMRKFYKPVVYAIFSLLFLASIDVASVISNFFTSLQASGSAFGFFKDAFSHSLFAVKIIILAETVIILMLAKDTVDKLVVRRSTI